MSSYVDATSGAVEHCRNMGKQFPEHNDTYALIAKQSQEKLWHQLTMTIMGFLDNKESTLKPLGESNNTFLELYQQVVLSVSSKLNNLSLARIANMVVFSSLKVSNNNPELVTQSKSIFDQLLSKSQQPATLYLESKIALLKITTTHAKEDLDSIATLIKTNAAIVNQMIPDTPEAAIVHSAHYEMSMAYFKLVGPPEAFYEEAIRYLNHYSIDSSTSSSTGVAIVQEEPTSTTYHQLAVDLCLAALTGDGVYNLGQVVTNPILKVLENTPEQWLLELLTACAQGNVSLFKDLVVNKYASHIAAQPALVNRGQAMQEKMTLLSLVQYVFERPSSQRTIALEDIATRIQMPLEQVEWVIMRAFSVELLKGSIDQVDGTVHVTWVMPRILDTTQLQDLATRFGEWAVKVNSVKEYMQQNNPILTS